MSINVEFIRPNRDVEPFGLTLAGDILDHILPQAALREGKDAAQDYLEFLRDAKSRLELADRELSGMANAAQFAARRAELAAKLEVASRPGAREAFRAEVLGNAAENVKFFPETPAALILAWHALEHTLRNSEDDAGKRQALDIAQVFLRTADSQLAEMQSEGSARFVSFRKKLDDRLDAAKAASAPAP